jgi:hypothetical protein
MAIKHESLDWLDRLAELKAQMDKMAKPTHGNLATVLGQTRSTITKLSSLIPIIDPAAADKIRQAAQAKPPFILGFNSARTLAGLNGKVADLPAAVHSTLDVVINRRLELRHIQALVERVIAGHPAAEFDPLKQQSKRQITSPIAEPELDTEELTPAKESVAPKGQSVGQRLDGTIEGVRVWAKKYKNGLVMVGVAAALVLWNYKDSLFKTTDASLSEPAQPTHSSGISTQTQTPQTIMSLAQPTALSPEALAKGETPAKAEAKNELNVEVPDELKGRTINDAAIAMEFAMNFYGVSYEVPSSNLKYLDDITNEHYTKAFFKEFYPPAKLKEIRAKKLFMDFQPSGPAKVLKVDRDSSEYLVEGVVSNLTDKGKKDQFISERPAGLIVDFDDRPSANGAVVKVTETSPEGKP